MKHRPLRAAFVVTVAVTAAQACSQDRGVVRRNPPPPPPTTTGSSALVVGNPPEPQPEPARVDPPRVVVASNPPGPLGFTGNGPECPPASPADGAACARAGLRCVYESCGVPDGAMATCGAQGWRVDRVTCNPPPPP